MTARVTDFGALRIQSAGLQAGEGIRWRLSLPAGSYRLTDVSGNLRDDLMVAITSDGIIHALTGARPTIEFTLHEDTECSFVIAARHQATGKQVDDVFLPMLSAVDSGAITWQPPETLTAQGTEYMPQNLIINPSFEDGLTGWTSSVPSGLTTVDSEPDSGIKSAKDGRLYLKNATNGINRAARSSTFNVIPGATLKVSAWVVSPVPGRAFTLAISFDGADPIIVANKVLATACVWTEVAGTITVPVDATEAQLLLYGSEWSRWDLVSVTEVI